MKQTKKDASSGTRRPWTTIALSVSTAACVVALWYVVYSSNQRVLAEQKLSAKHSATQAALRENPFRCKLVSTGIYEGSKKVEFS